MMGQNLSEPVTEKSSADGGDERLIYGVASMQGWRFSMEDSHSAVLDLQPIIGKKNESKLSFFGVYDGHGGDKVAQFAGENLHIIISVQDAYEHGNIEQALKDGFLATDRAILNDPKFENEASGCTATVGIISDTKIFVANAGDSRSVLGVKGRAKPLSFDHKPLNEGEKARIISAGGTVEQGRVNGNLALSRAIGDFDFKKSAYLAPEQQAVTVYPDVTIHDISNDDEFMVIACDGIWDCRSSQDVVEFVRRGIAAKQELSKICENLMDNCLSPESEPGGIGCDNMTLMIIGLLHGKSKEEWYEEIARRVSDGDGPCAPPEYAELRGPSVNKNFVDSDNLEEPSKGISGHFRRIILLSDGSDSLTNSDDTVLFDISDDDLEFSNQVSKFPDSEYSEAFQLDGFRGFRREKSNESHADDDNDTDDSGQGSLPANSSHRLQNSSYRPNAADTVEPQERKFFSTSGYQRFRPKSPDSDVEEETEETNDHSESRNGAYVESGIRKFQSENSRDNKSNDIDDIKKFKEKEVGGLQRFRSKSPGH